MSPIKSWERKLLDRIRQIRKTPTAVIVITFTDTDVMLQIAAKTERIVSEEREKP